MNKIKYEEERKRTKAFFILPNILLLLLALVAILAARHIYSERIHSLNLKENRFITTEWYLLQTLVNQTEQELREKDREIEALRLRYARLLRSNSDSDQLTQLELEIEEALADRETIVNRRLQNTIETTDSPPAPIIKAEKTDAGITPASSRAGSDALLIRLRERMRELADQLEEDQEHISKLETEISVRAAAPADPSPDPSAEYELQLHELQTLKTRSYEIQAQIQQRLQELENESDGAVEGLISYQLVRALLSSPAIRSQYPELLADLDAYIEELSRQEQNKRRYEAYSQSLDLVDKITE